MAVKMWSKQICKVSKPVLIESIMPSNELFRASAKIEPRAVAFKGEPELPSSFDAGAVVIHFPPFGNGGFAEDLRASHFY